MPLPLLVHHHQLPSLRSEDARRQAQVELADRTAVARRRAQHAIPLSTLKKDAVEKRDPTDPSDGKDPAERRERE
tara:strand:+ start:2739 stop:2963 length:225 start_codon:yes stop_codon:yes gene_type:complete